MTEWEVVGVIVVLLGLVTTVVGFVNSNNKRWEEFNKNLVENTLTLRQIQEYLNHYEVETNKRFDRHEERMDRQDERLDQHHEHIILLENKVKITQPEKNGHKV